jgi:hypothetical protein
MKKKGANVQNDFAQIFDGLKNSSKSKSEDTKIIEKKSIESERIEQPVLDQETIDTKETNNIEHKSIDQESIEQKSIEKNTPETKSPGIHPTSIRVVKEELLKAMAGHAIAEVKIGDIAPLTGLTRRTVDRVCKHLEDIKEFTFERQHRGMKITNLKP